MLVIFLVILAATVSMPSPIQAQSVRLELEEVSIDAKAMMFPDRWRHDAQQGTAQWSPPFGQASYRVQLPNVIDASSRGNLSIRVTAEARSRFAPGMGLKGEVDVNPAANLGVLAEPGETKAGSNTFTIAPRNYSPEVRSIVLTVGIQDGPTFSYRYRIVRSGAPRSPPTIARQGLYLELEQVTAEGKGIMLADRWTYDPGQGTAQWSPPFERASYRVELPKVIDSAGPSGSFSLRVTAAERSRFAPGMGLKGEVDVNPAANLGVLAEAGETKEEKKVFTMVPRRYSPEVPSIVLVVEIQDGPTFYYRYRIVR